MVEHNGYSGLPSSEYGKFPKPGDRMVFLGENGHDHELEEAIGIFGIGEELVVEQCEVGAWDHRVWFEGHEGWFNGVMFGPAPVIQGMPPWSDEQVRKLNEFQACGHVHPFTCPGDGDCPSRELIATNEGWICSCGEYTQEWAHAAMFDGAPTNPFELVSGKSGGEAGQGNGGRD